MEGVISISMVYIDAGLFIYELLELTVMIRSST